MPKRSDLKRIMLIGSGPIIIGQACEFDYSGTQACKALREEGYEVVLVNSNPATIMTDTDFADRTYIEPITPEIVGKIIERERPDALLPTIGGQTGLNIAISLHEMGILQKFGVELIGASFEAIQKAEDRNLFRKAMEKLGLTVPRSGYIRSIEEALQVIPDIGYPAIIRPSFTLGGTGAGIAYNREEFEEAIRWALDASPKRTVLVEQSVIGWKEFELEVMRDLADNVVIICSIENLDPMGVHTGDSITVAPAQTLTDKEYQIMRNASLRIIREIGVDTGGSNIQFAVHPETGEMVVIEMNPRVSRSSALASKATGFPIAKIAAKLAVGYTLDEIRNDITRETPASFEPTIDYVVTKIPRFTFEKFPQTEDVLGTQMKSVGEVMAIGRTFKESLQKAIRSLENGVYGFEEMILPSVPPNPAARRKTITDKLRKPNSLRLYFIGEAFRDGWTVEEIREPTGIDPWFLENIRQIIAMEGEIRARAEAFRREAAQRPVAFAPFLRRMKGNGFSDRRLSKLLGVGEDDVRRIRYAAGVRAVYKRVDTCGAEFEAHTPYLYSTYEQESEGDPTDRKKVVILGGGAEPDRPGDRIRLLLRPRSLRAARGRVRDDHGELQPRNRFHRLRLLRPPLLRAPDEGGRSRHHRGGETVRRDRPVRRPDSAETRRPARKGGGPDPRDVAGEHRPGRGSGAVRGDAEPAGAFPAAERDRAVHPRCGLNRRPDRIPRPASSFLRSRRAGDGDRP